MSWFTSKASQEDFEYLVKKVQSQNAEIIKLEGKIQALDTALSLLRIRVTELENLNKLCENYSNSSYVSSSSCGGK